MSQPIYLIQKRFLASASHILGQNLDDRSFKKEVQDYLEIHPISDLFRNHVLILSVFLTFLDIGPQGLPPLACLNNGINFN